MGYYGGNSGGSEAVASVFGRTGAVAAQNGDYTPAQVGADPAGSASTVQEDIDAHEGRTDNPHTVTPAQVGNATAQWNADKLQGVNVHTAAPGDGQVLQYIAANTRWEPTTPTSGGSGSGGVEVKDVVFLRVSGGQMVTHQVDFAAAELAANDVILVDGFATADFGFGAECSVKVGYGDDTVVHQIFYSELQRVRYSMIVRGDATHSDGSPPARSFWVHSWDPDAGNQLSISNSIAMTSAWWIRFTTVNEVTDIIGEALSGNVLIVRGS